MLPVLNPIFMRGIKFIFIYFLTFLFLTPLAAQDLISEDEVCPSESVTLNTPTDPSFQTFNWDFCTGDLAQTPDATVITSFIPNAFGPEGIELVLDDKNTRDLSDDEWFGFITNRIGTNVIRMEFGSDLGNTNPSYASYSIGLERCYEMAFTRENGIWYALVARALFNPILLKFDSLQGLRDNNPEIFAVLSDSLVSANPNLFLRHQTTTKLAKDGDKFVGLFLNNQNSLAGVNPMIDDTRLISVDFGNSVATRVTDNFVTSDNVTPYNPVLFGFENNQGFDIVNENGSWYGIACGVDNIRHLSFGNSLLNPPVITDITDNIANFNSSWVNIRTRLVRDGGRYYAFVINWEGQFFQLDFGTTMGNLSPTITKYGSFDRLGTTSTPSISSTFDIAKHNSVWYAFVINRSIFNNDPFNPSSLVRIKFPNPCNVNPAFSQEEIPTDIDFILPGDYDVDLQITNENLLQVGDFTDQITISNATVGNFITDNLCIGDTIIFQNTSLGADDNVERWDWDFGDQSTSNERDPRHFYSEPGVYNVTLTVVNKNGCTIPFQKSVKISSRPVADFIVKSIDCENGVVVFEDKSFSSSLDVNNGIGIRKREWLFGDGTRYIASAADAGGNTRVIVTKGRVNAEDIVQQDKAYDPNQLYQVSLTITDSTNCASTLVRTISFRSEDRPNVDFSFEKACAGTITQFTDLSSLSEQAIGPIDTWVWKVFSPSGQLIDSTGTQNPSIIFPVPGIYQVELSARYSGACANTLVKSVEVLESSTSLFNTSIDLGPAPLTVSFTNQSTGAESFEWNFGNGLVSSEESPTITYNEPGVYIVQFQSRNANGCGTISFASITVLADSLTTALEPINDDNFSFYPNPVREELFIELKQNHTDIQLEMLNPLAQTFPISYERMTPQLLRVRLDELPKGLYFLYIETEKGKTIKRIIRQ